MSEYRVNLEIYNGPLDLLLYLIHRSEVDIQDIQIAAITEQYLQYISLLEELNIDSAGEFLVMAATLMEIKSNMLLPRPEVAEGDEGENLLDPRVELIRQLLEYKKFKEAAFKIGDLMHEAQKFLPRHGKPSKEEKMPRDLKPTDKIEVWNVFNQVLRRLADKITTGEIHGEVVTVADRMEELLEILQKQRQFRFTSLFNEKTHSLNFLVSTFLAVLELVRLRKMNIEQEREFEDILCTACEEPETNTVVDQELENLDQNSGME
ncbi:MAG: segregation/condensation protein A [Planctomycetes bacterium]|nr:segregation/condensation protein A [Planctomycetota bacterium]